MFYYDNIANEFNKRAQADRQKRKIFSAIVYIIAIVILAATVYSVVTLWPLLVRFFVALVETLEARVG